MKPLCGFIIALLVTQQGCSYYLLTQAEVNEGKIPPEASIRVTRIDSSVVESGPFRHLVVGGPSDLVIGSGMERRSGKLFAGTVSRSEIDSARQIQVMSTDGVRETFLVCWLKNKISIGFAEYDYLDITPEHAVGLWSVGTVTDRGRTEPFKGRIDSADIKMIEAEGLSLFRPALSTRGRHWANIGIGSGREGIGGREAAAFLVSYSYLSGNTLYSARMIGSFPVPVPGGEGESLTFFEIGGLFGLGFKSRFLTATMSGGISYVKGSEKLKFPLELKFSTVSFPLDLEVALTPFESFGDRKSVV